MNHLSITVNYLVNHTVSELLQLDASIITKFVGQLIPVLAIVMLYWFIDTWKQSFSMLVANLVNGVMVDFVYLVNEGRVHSLVNKGYFKNGSFSFIYQIYKVHHYTISQVQHNIEKGLDTAIPEVSFINQAVHSTVPTCAILTCLGARLYYLCRDKKWSTFAQLCKKILCRQGLSQVCL